MRRDINVEERKHAKHLLRGRRKLDFHKESLPLSKRTFYLDLKGHRQVKSIENDIKALGGIIESFLSKEIKYFITNQSFKPKAAPENNASPNSTGSPAISTPSPFSNLCPASSAGARTSISRGKSMIQRAKIDTQATRTLENAQKWGVKIVALDTVLKWITKEKEKLRKTKREPAKPKPVVKRNTSSKYKRLQPPFVKFEAAHLQYRPIQQQLPQWPTIGLQTPAGTCPFDGTTIGHGQRSERAERPGPTLGDGVGRISSGSTKHGSLKKNPSNGGSVGFSGMRILTAGDLRRLREQKRQAERKKGFCECCQVKYEDLEKHLRNDDHRKFVRNPAHYTSLDTVIVQTYDVSAFLQDALSKRSPKPDITKSFVCHSPLVDDVSLISELSSHPAHKLPFGLSAVSPHPVPKQLFTPIASPSHSLNKPLTNISKRSPRRTSKKLSRWSCKKSGELPKSSHKRSLFRLNENCPDLKNVCCVSMGQEMVNNTSTAYAKNTEEEVAAPQKKSTSVISLKNIVSPSAIHDQNKMITIESSNSPVAKESLDACIDVLPGADKVDNPASLSNSEHSSRIQLKPDNGTRSPSPIFKKAKRPPRMKLVDLLAGTEIELYGEFAMSAYDKVKLRHRKSTSATGSEASIKKKTPNTSCSTPQSQKSNASRGSQQMKALPITPCSTPQSQKSIASQDSQQMKALPIMSCSTPQSQKSNASQGSQQMKAVSVVLKNIALSAGSSMTVSSDTIPYKYEVEALAVGTRASSVELVTTASEGNSNLKVEHPSNRIKVKSIPPKQSLSLNHVNASDVSRVISNPDNTVSRKKVSSSKELCIKVVDIFEKPPVLNHSRDFMKISTIDLGIVKMPILRDDTVSTPSAQQESKRRNPCTPKMSGGDHIRLDKRCKLLSDRSVQKVLSCEMASETFHGFTREQTKLPHFVDTKSDVSFVEVSELSIPPDDHYEWDYTGIEAAPSTIKEDTNLDAHFLVDAACTVSEDSSWGDACDKFVSSHVTSSIIKQKTGSLLSSSIDKPSTRSQTIIFSRPGSPSRCAKNVSMSSPLSKNFPKSPLRTPTRRSALRRTLQSENNSQTQCKTDNARKEYPDHDHDFDALGLIRIDEDIQFNYSSPQKTRPVLRSELSSPRCRKRDNSHLDGCNDLFEKPRSRRKLLRSPHRSTSSKNVASKLAS